MEVEVRKPTEEEKNQAAAWPTWDCKPSEFDWSYSTKETCLVLEGSVEVEACGKTYAFGAGDWVVFPQGMDCRWKVKEYIKKHYKMG